MKKLDISTDEWNEVDACICEIEWFATRAKDLGAKVDKQDKTWADMLMSDISDLRVALAKVQDSAPQRHVEQGK